MKSISLRKWTEVPAGEVNAATQRLLVALGDKADLVIRLFNRTDQPFVLRVIADYIAQYSIAFSFPGFSLTVETIPLFIRYGEMEEQIRAGSYDCEEREKRVFNPSNFPTSVIGNVNREGLLVNFGRRMENELTKEALDLLGLRPGNLDELLSVGVIYPEKQKQYQIVALGTCSPKIPGVPLLGSWSETLRGNELRRGLALSSLEVDWDETTRFLAFRKDTPSLIRNWESWEI